MTLVERMSEDFTYMNKSVINTAYGVDTKYSDGAVFKAVATYQNSVDERIAEKENKIGTWLITVLDDVPLVKNDVIRRNSDNKYFKIDVPNANIKSPSFSGIPFKTQCYAFDFEGDI